MNLFWSWNEQKLVASLNSKVQITAYQLVLRDVYTVSLAYVSEQAVTNQPYIAGAIVAGTSILFCAKVKGAPTGAALIRAATWTPSGTGVTTRYAADLELNTQSLIDALGTTTSLALTGEFAIVRGDNNNEYSTQFDISVIPDYNREEDINPSTVFPAVQQYTADDGTNFVRLVNSNGEIVGLFGNGSPYTYVASTGLWHPMTAIVVDNIPTPSFGAGVNA